VAAFNHVDSVSTRRLAYVHGNTQQIGRAAGSTESCQQDDKENKKRKRKGPLYYSIPDHIRRVRGQFGSSSMAFVFDELRYWQCCRDGTRRGEASEMSTMSRTAYSISACSCQCALPDHVTPTRSNAFRLVSSSSYTPRLQNSSSNTLVAIRSTLSPSRPSLPPRRALILTAEDVRIAQVSSADVTSTRRLETCLEMPVDLRCTRRARPFASQASVWTISLLEMHFTIHSIIQVSFRKFSLSPFALISRSPFQCFHFYLRPFFIERSPYLPQPHCLRARRCAPRYDSVKFLHFEHHCPSSTALCGSVTGRIVFVFVLLSNSPCM